MTEGQHWDPRGYDRHARFVSDLGAPLLEWLAPRLGERVLDLGCGDGVLTAQLVERGCEVVAVDASAEFVAAACARGLDARVMDGQRLTFAGQFDAVFSNAALHWMRDADAVIEGVARALRPAGRFVAEMGGHGNVATIVAALQAELEVRGVDAAACNPWYFPTPEDYAARLRAGGFVVTRIELVPRPTPLPGDIGGWLVTFAGSYAAALPASERAAFLAAVAARLAGSLRDAEGRWTADYVRLRFAARLGS